MTVQHRSVQSVRAKGAGVFDALAVTYMSTPDMYGSLWAPGVFTESLNERLPVVMWGHDNTDPIGRATSWRDTAGGPVLTARLDMHPDVPRALQAFAQLQSGTLDSVSVGFQYLERRDPTEDEYKRWPTAREVVTKARMLEISIVYVGAVPGAEVLAVRSRDHASRAALLASGRISPSEYRGIGSLDAEVEEALRIVERRKSETNAMALASWMGRRR